MIFKKLLDSAKVDKYASSLIEEGIIDAVESVIEKETDEKAVVYCYYCFKNHKHTYIYSFEYIHVCVYLNA